MKLEATLITLLDQEISDVESVTITHGDLVLDIRPSRDGLLVRLDRPASKQLAVFPRTVNSVVLMATREDEAK